MKKTTYNSPVIEVIKLDYEISLSLESTPPLGPEEESAFHFNYLSNDPYQILT